MVIRVGGVVMVTKYHHGKLSRAWSVRGYKVNRGLCGLWFLCPKSWLFALNSSTSSPDIGYVSEPPRYKSKSPVISQSNRKHDGYAAVMRTLHQSIQSRWVSWMGSWRVSLYMECRTIPDHPPPGIPSNYHTEVPAILSHSCSCYFSSPFCSFLIPLYLLFYSFFLPFLLLSPPLFLLSYPFLLLSPPLFLLSPPLFTGSLPNCMWRLEEPGVCLLVAAISPSPFYRPVMCVIRHHH